MDYVVTEQSVRASFSELFGADCDVFAKLMYIKMANCRELCELNFLDFTSSFVPFYVSHLMHNCAD